MAAEIQALLRFLTQDAKTPLAVAIGKVKELQDVGLGSAEAISKSSPQTLQPIFSDAKLSKQILAAAKRVSKKRKASDTANPPPTPRKKSKFQESGPLTPAEVEDSLALPRAEKDEVMLEQAVVYTNRAPLVLAFAVTLLKFTMPEQPLSSRLSLAQAVVSMNSRSKAVSLGLESGRDAEEEGWGEGQPSMRVMGREVRVMKRWGYEWKENDSGAGASVGDEGRGEGGEEAVKKEEEETKPALWALDLEAYKKNNDGKGNAYTSSRSELPIYTPQSARAYLLKSFDTPPAQQPEDKSVGSKKSNASKIAAKERNLGLLLGALELLFESWAVTLEPAELDRRAWGWYVRVRPEVESGVKGWGGKGSVKIADILHMRKKG